MLSPGYVSMPPAMPYNPPQAFAPPPAPRPAVQSQPRPLVRAKGPDEPPPPRPAPLSMPSPDQLGVVVPPRTPAGPDWAAIHARIKELGVVSFHMDSLADGRCRFTCWVPGSQPGLTQRIEAVAANEADAVRLGLDRAAQGR